ncbi:hypothetical protein [Telluria antibiotica]|uniref:hypothetical protein n=1 Tax=Telluria antibiotica TaxID=2717319 RepID=UPI00280C21D6|nr:hypothetical protein [Telluria antibiotica]
MHALGALQCVFGERAFRQSPLHPLPEDDPFTLTWADTDDAQFARAGQASGAGKSPRTGVDSNLGLQADYRVNDWLSLTGQGLVSKDGADDYGADLSWAFAKVKLSDQWSVRVGRVGMPVFMISDYRHVGYANTMLRPAQEVYNQIPVSHLDGGDITWQQNYGDTSVSASFSVGRNKTDQATITSEHAVNFVIEHGPLTLRAGQVDGKLTLTVPVTLPGGKTSMVTLPARRVWFDSAGAMLDWNNIVLQTEVAKTHGLVGISRSWYAMAGYRFGKVLPYYNHSSTTGVSAQSTNSIGMRWDAFRSADIKVQIDRVDPQTTGFFVNAKPGFRGPVTVGAVAIDFVFYGRFHDQQHQGPDGHNPPRRMRARPGRSGRHRQSEGGGRQHVARPGRPGLPGQVDIHDAGRPARKRGHPRRVLQESDRQGTVPGEGPVVEAGLYRQGHDA